MTEPQDELIPKNNQEEADHDEINSNDLTDATSPNRKPASSKVEEEHANGQQSKRLRYASIILSIIAVAISAIAACFTYQQVAVAKDTAGKQLRAYVHAVPSTLYHTDGKSGALQAYVDIRNAGQTFAHNVERSVGIIVSESGVPDEVSDFMEREPGKFVIGPGGTNTTIRNGPQLTDDQAYRIKNKDNPRIYVIGTILYEDVWGASHKTDFCFMYFGYEDAAHPTPDLGRLYLPRQGKYCDNHNKAD